MPFGFKFPNLFARKKPVEEIPSVEPIEDSLEEKPIVHTIEIEPYHYPATLEELEREIQNPADRIRVAICKTARDTGAIIAVDNVDRNHAIGMLVEPDDNGDVWNSPQFAAVMAAFVANGHPQGEFKNSDDGGSLSTEANWEAHRTGRYGNKYIVRAFMNPDQQKPSDMKFHLFNLEKKYVNGR